MQYFHGAPHGAGYRRSICIFYFDAVPFPSAEVENIQLRPGMHGPKIYVPASDYRYYLFENKAFPGRADFRVTGQFRFGAERKKRVEKSGITNVDLRSFYLPFFHVFIPRLQLPDYVGTRQNVEIPTCRYLRAAKGPREFGGIPNLSMIMSDHGPESPEGFGGNGYT